MEILKYTHWKMTHTSRTTHVNLKRSIYLSIPSLFFSFWFYEQKTLKIYTKRPSTKNEETTRNPNIEWRRQNYHVQTFFVQHLNNDLCLPELKRFGWTGRSGHSFLSRSSSLTLSYQHIELFTDLIKMH